MPTGLSARVKPCKPPEKSREAGKTQGEAARILGGLARLGQPAIEPDPDAQIVEAS
jgi:hypothetical protein